MKLKNSTQLSFLLFSFVFFGNLKAQSFPGVFGRKNIAGAKFDLILEPISLYKHLYYERMVGRRTNIGASFHFGNATHQIDRIENYISPNYNITTKLNSIDRTVVDVDGDFQQKKSGFEIYIKRFSKRNPMRNYGWFWSYKFGQLRAVSILKSGAEVDVIDLNNINNFETYKTNNDSRSVTKSSYLGFELGRSVPFFKDGLMFTYSLSFNGFLNSTEEVYNTSLGEYLKNYGKNYINNTHLISFNAGLCYAF